MTHLSVGEFKAEHHDYTENGECSNCGACCSNLLPLTKKEIRTIAQYIAKHNIQPINHVPVTLTEKTLDGICPFRDDINEKCIIYDARPLICKIYRCNKSVKDIQCEATQKLKQKTKARPYDVRSTFYGDGSFSRSSIITAIESCKEAKRCVAEFQDLLGNAQQRI